MMIFTGFFCVGFVKIMLIYVDLFCVGEHILLYRIYCVLMLWSLLHWQGLIADFHSSVVVIVTMTGDHHQNDMVCDLCYCMFWSLLQWPVVILIITTTLSCRTMTTVLVTMTGDHCLNDCKTGSLLQWPQDEVIVIMTARRGHCYNDRKTRSLLQWTMVIVIMTALQINTITDQSLL